MSDGTRRVWAWLFLGAALELVANGRWIIPPATWLAPIGWLVFLHRQRLRVAVPAALAAYMMVDFVAWRGLVPAPGGLYYLIVGTYAVVYFLPFLIHRLLAPRLEGPAATLIFPAAWVGLEFAFQRWATPYGTWFSVAYTQTDFLPLMQLAALTGAAGVSFLVSWSAAVAAWMLEARRSERERRLVALAWGVVIAVSIGGGAIRLMLVADRRPLVRVAGIIPSPSLTGDLEQALAPVRRGLALDQAGMAGITGISARLNDDLLARTVREAQAGARLVAWSETAGRVVKADEQPLLQRASRLAREEDVDLLIAYGVWTLGASPPFENKVVAVSRRGEVVWEFEKANPIVGPESPYVRAGDGVLHAMETPFGVVSAVICHDLDFAPLARKAYPLRPGLMVGPAADWPAITPLHADMAAVRAIENGFSLFRPTSGGRSLAVDPYGHASLAVDYASDAVVAYLPVKPVATLYGVMGDWFAWLCLAGTIGGAGFALVRRGQRAAGPPRRGQ